MTPVAGESAAEFLRRMAVTRTNPTRKAWQEAAKVLEGIDLSEQGKLAPYVVIPVRYGGQLVGHLMVTAKMGSFDVRSDQISPEVIGDVKFARTQ